MCSAVSAVSGDDVDESIRLVAEVLAIRGRQMALATSAKILTVSGVISRSSGSKPSKGRCTLPVRTASREGPLRRAVRTGSAYRP